MSLRLFLALLTAVGGAISLTAAGIIVWRSVKAAQRERAIARMRLKHQQSIKERDAIAGKQIDDAMTAMTMGWEPPTGGVDLEELERTIEGDYAAEHRRLLGYEPGDDPSAVERPVAADLLAQFSVPAVLAVVGTVVSTVAGVWSIYLD